MQSVIILLLNIFSLFSKKVDQNFLSTLFAQIGSFTSSILYKDHKDKTSNLHVVKNKFSTYKNRKHPFLGTLGPLDSAEDFQSKQKTNTL